MSTTLLHKEHFGVLFQVHESGPRFRSILSDKAKLSSSTICIVVYSGFCSFYFSFIVVIPAFGGTLLVRLVISKELLVISKKLLVAE